MTELSEAEIQVSAKPLRALEEIRRMRGGSQSHLMRCSDDHYYVVKFQNNPQHRRVLVNELLATRLATLLGLPTTTGAIIEVSEELIRVTDDLVIEMARQRIPCQAGPQFGSRYPGDPRKLALHDFLPDEKMRQVANLHDFAGMLVFDKWTCNTDGRQILFKKERNEACYLMTMIDQGFCFNCGEWNFPDAPLRGLYTLRRVYAEIRSLDDFEPWLSILEEEFNVGVLFDAANGLPPEWYEGDTRSLHKLLEDLNRRRSKVRELLQIACQGLPHTFPNWVCGERRGGQPRFAGA